jgi:hypothetical protein
VYRLFEGQANFAARAEAFRQRHLAEYAEEVPFRLMPSNWNWSKIIRAS